MSSMNKEELMKEYTVAGEWIAGMAQSYLDQCKLLKIQKGETIFRGGNELQYVYIIFRGTATISSSNIKGDEMNVVFAEQGTMIGEVETIIGLEWRIFNASAFTECVLFAIPHVVFRKWSDQDVDVCRKLNHMFAQKLYKVASAAVHYNQAKAEIRLKLFLIYHGEGKVKETREELAKVCGVNVRTIYRIIEKMENDGFINIKNGKIEITKAHISKMQKRIAEE
ncbi:cAMP-binding domain of CRP or a regulatory subunit of cAMP-dependent protein kinases [Anaerobium acetethylicum]|uniref:cAMP-binding domain of CRP or a regulatory subunit of cAMP-dependent protein kinases n=2 Tax=Anaerobium acetethylicum TaxID=1619234 RepID=A0A1D3TV30_9FIRM|nr:cAMP-binding domain of CRP or a regulatory subunit of cAMP-dependent protein kinases [Anaerobium acetethylicum]